jgi:hypothetical protein
MVVEKLTSILIEDFNPNFLAYDFFEDTQGKEQMSIVISSDCFINQKMDLRVRSIYSTIEKKCPEILEKNSVYVHTFTEDEIISVIEHTTKEGS